MTAPITSFQDVIDDGFLASLDAQRRLADAVGPGTPCDGRYDVDLRAGILTFTGTQQLDVRAHFLGSAAPGPGSWAWGWDNRNGFPDAVVAYVRHVHDFGTQVGVHELVVAEHPLRGTPREEAVRYATAASIICGGLPHYTLEAGGGTVAALLVDSSAFAPGPPSAVRAATLLPDAAARGVIADWRRAVVSYAQVRGFGIQEADRTLTLSAPDGTVGITLDAHGRLAHVDGSLHGAGSV